MITDISLSKTDLKTISTCLILRLKELRSRKNWQEDARITKIQSVLEKIK